MSRGVFILAVGDELLDGRSSDRNSHWLMQRLAALDVGVIGVEVVGDAQAEIVAALRRAAMRSDFVLVTGGLGPTSDDRTRAALAEFAGLTLELDAAVLSGIRQRFAARGKAMPAGNERQAMRPPGSIWLPNSLGTAPGLLLQSDDVHFALMPGVPAEMRRMWEEELAPLLAEHVGGRRGAQIRVRLARAGESAIAARVENWLRTQPKLEVGYCVHDFGVDVLLRGERDTNLRPLAEGLALELAPRVFGVGEAGLIELLLARLRQRAQSLCVAESCTGGLLAGAITDVPGSSEVFLGGVIAYADRIKEEALGVDAATLSQHGAVSEAVVRAMAIGARSRLGADIALASTGIAGPSGGSEAKPVGTVWIALSDAAGVQSECLRLSGDRESNRRQSVAAALDLLRLRLCDGRLDR